MDESPYVRPPLEALLHKRSTRHSFYRKGDTWLTVAMLGAGASARYWPGTGTMLAAAILPIWSFSIANAFMRRARGQGLLRDMMLSGEALPAIVRTVVNCHILRVLLPHAALVSGFVLNHDGLSRCLLAAMASYSLSVAGVYGGVIMAVSPRTFIRGGLRFLLKIVAGVSFVLASLLLGYCYAERISDLYFRRPVLMRIVILLIPSVPMLGMGLIALWRSRHQPLRDRDLTDYLTENIEGDLEL